MYKKKCIKGDKVNAADSGTHKKKRKEKKRKKKRGKNRKKKKEKENPPAHSLKLKTLG